MFPRVALEYGHVWCAASTRAWATSGSKPGRLTLRRAPLTNLAVRSPDAPIGRIRCHSFYLSAKWEGKDRAG